MKGYKFWRSYQRTLARHSSGSFSECLSVCVRVCLCVAEEPGQHTHTSRLMDAVRGVIFVPQAAPQKVSVRSEEVMWFIQELVVVVVVPVEHSSQAAVLSRAVMHSSV